MKIKKISAALVTAAAMAVSLLSFGASAEPETVEDYGIAVLGKQVTSENAADIFGDGSVTYDPEENALTFNSDIEYSGGNYLLNNNKDGLTIRTSKAVTLKTDWAGFFIKKNTTIETNGKLTIECPSDAMPIFLYNYYDRIVLTVKDSELDLKGYTGMFGYGDMWGYDSHSALKIINSDITIDALDGQYGIVDFDEGIELECCEITSPEGAVNKDGNIYESDGKTIAKKVTIAPGGHVEGEAVKENEVPADCENEGSYDEVVYCTVCGDELSRETMTIDALDHDWGEPTYEWAEDGSYCTARVVCNRDEGHVIGEKAMATSQVKTPATEDEKGTTTYTANFETELFETQTLDLQDIPTLEPEEESGEEGSEPESSEESSDPESSEPESEPEKPAPTPQDQGTNPATGAAAGLAVIAIASAAAVALKKRK
ncbi:MAG: hypothetical protein IJ746_04365 [Ruminococcus sp.]|nr:hypothetical protein [Ruminococcus sp.]